MLQRSERRLGSSGSSPGFHRYRRAVAEHALDRVHTRQSAGFDELWPGITKSDLLVINKIDLAPLVGASLEVMAHDAKKMRGERPFVFTNLKSGHGLDVIARFIENAGLLAANPSVPEREKP